MHAHSAGLVEDDLHSSALVELMPQYRSAEFGIYAVYSSRQFVSAKVRLLIEFLAKALGKTNWLLSHQAVLHAGIIVESNLAQRRTRYVA